MFWEQFPIQRLSFAVSAKFTKCSIKTKMAILRVLSVLKVFIRTVDHAPHNIQHVITSINNAFFCSMPWRFMCQGCFLSSVGLLWDLQAQRHKNQLFLCKLSRKICTNSFFSLCRGTKMHDVMSNLYVTLCVRWPVHVPHGQVLLHVGGCAQLIKQKICWLWTFSRR